MGGVDDAAFEQRAERGVNVFDHLPDVGTVELAAAVRAAASVDGAREQAVEVLDAAAEEGTAVEQGPFAGADRDPAIHLAQQGRGLEFAVAGGRGSGIGVRCEGELVGVQEGEAFAAKAQPGRNLVRRQPMANAFDDQDFGGRVHRPDSGDDALKHRHRDGDRRSERVTEIRLQQDALRGAGRFRWGIDKIVGIGDVHEPSVKMTPVRVQVLFFGLLRDLMGTSQESLDLGESPAGGYRLRDVFLHYAERDPRLAGLAASIVLARNQSFETPDCLIADGDEIAFLPPVSGGTGPYSHVIQDPEGHFFALTRERIDTETLKRQILASHDGAMVDFEGVVRDNTKGRATRFLDYECYEAMAIKMMAQIGREIAAAHAISRIALVHRLGRLEIGEASVVVIATSPHRGPAFAAALDGINRLKKTVPIWKKEYFADGEVWVDGDWDDTVVTRAGTGP